MSATFRWVMLVVLWCGCPLEAQKVLVLPYLQPGPAASGQLDQKTVLWLTDPVPGKFTVEFGLSNVWRRAAAIRRELHPSANQKFFLYAADFSALPLNRRIRYHVLLGTNLVSEGSFATRKTANQPLRFTVVGDMADGKISPKKIAWQIGRIDPEFMIAVGDLVYRNGTLAEYLDHFFPVYDRSAPRPDGGADFMRFAPLYAVLGNHDVLPGLNLNKTRGGLAAFYFFQAPANNLKTCNSFPPLTGALAALSRFEQLASRSYPGLCFYSFDNGPVHFLCLDSNDYVHPDDPDLRRWIDADLSRSRSRWKFVFFHHAPFHSSWKHLEEQRMRALSPVFERGGVDLVFSGHVHNYQRTKPLRFNPAPVRGAFYRRVDGAFYFDERFDGQTITRPYGIIYIVTGGGGADLVNPELSGKPGKWEYGPARPVSFTQKLVSNRHSFTLVEAEFNKLRLSQIDEDGKLVDQIQITKE